jgi:hypothetical protein
VASKSVAPSGGTRRGWLSKGHRADTLLFTSGMRVGWNSALSVVGYGAAGSRAKHWFEDAGCSVDKPNICNIVPFDLVGVRQSIID